MLQFVVVLTSDSKEFNILMPIFIFPLINSVLGHLPFGSSHFYLICFRIGIELVLMIVLEPVNEAGTVRVGGFSHQSVNDPILNFQLVFFVVLD